jgi:hypothetical protein
MTRARRAAVAAGALVSGAAAFVLGFAGSELRSDGRVALTLGIMTALGIWPLFLRGIPWSARAALSAAVFAALIAGLRSSDCGRDGQGSASEICLGQCAESVRRVRAFERDCWSVSSGRLGRWALAITCASKDALRDWRGAECASTALSR